ncbi:MAG: fluoride efflux transporter CrcB [Thermodesulfobacteriota bacterium]|nr:fluoride efflux transporter CrcB [Thermodesulfobacteriota bacterium]
MIKFMVIMAGGGLGAAFRHGLFLLVQRFSGPTFPYGTLAVNLLGSFLIGFLWCFFESSRITTEWRVFIFTGFLGGFTTFSTFAREAMQMFKIGQWKPAMTYIIASNLIGILLVFAGFFLARRMLGLPGE